MSPLFICWLDSLLVETSPNESKNHWGRGEVDFFKIFCLSGFTIQWWAVYEQRESRSQLKPYQTHSEAPFGRASALPKTAPALTPQMERLFWWSWSRFRKYLAKQLHLLDWCVSRVKPRFHGFTLPCVSRWWLQNRLHVWSRSQNKCLRGIHLKPLVKPPQEPCQTEPKSNRACCSSRMLDVRTKIKASRWFEPRIAVSIKKFYRTRLGKRVGSTSAQLLPDSEFFIFFIWSSTRMQH